VCLNGDSPTWCSILKVSLFCLSAIAKDNNTFHKHKAVFEYIDKHWDAFKIGTRGGVSWKKACQDALSHNPHLFESGHKALKKTGFWRLNPFKSPWQKNTGKRQRGRPKKEQSVIKSYDLSPVSSPSSVSSFSPSPLTSPSTPSPSISPIPVSPKINNNQIYNLLNSQNVEQFQLANNYYVQANIFPQILPQQQQLTKQRIVIPSCTISYSQPILPSISSLYPKEMQKEELSESELCCSAIEGLCNLIRAKNRFHPYLRK